MVFDNTHIFIRSLFIDVGLYYVCIEPHVICSPLNEVCLITVLTLSGFWQLWKIEVGGILHTKTHLSFVIYGQQHCGL